MTKVTTEKHAAVNEGGRIKRLQDAALTRKKPEGIDEIALTARRTALLESVAKLQTLASSRAFSTIETAATVEQYKRDKLEQLTIYNSAKEQIATLSAETTKFLSCAQCPTCLATGTDWQAPWKREQDTKVTRLQQKLDVATIEGTRLKKLIEVTELLLTQMRGQEMCIRDRNV